MFKYLIQRIALAILTILIITIVTYTLVAWFSHEPWSQEFVNKGGAQKFKMTSLQYVQQKMVENGWGRFDAEGQFHRIPIIERFFIYVGGIFKGDFGKIYLDTNRSISDYIPTVFFKPLKWTIIVTVPSFIMSVILGVLLGIWSGYKRGTWVDSVINTSSLLFVALPSFVIAPFAIQIAMKLGIAPEVLNPEKQTSATGTEIFLSYLPVILVVTLTSMVGYVIYTRNMLITVINSNYVLIAKSKGLSQTQIFFKYILRNISIPLSASIITSYMILLSGSLVIERYWNIPGSSQLIVNSFPNGEVNIVMFNILFFTSLGIFNTILVDVSYVLLDPRIKYGQKSPKSLSAQIKAYFVRRKLIKELIAKEKGVTNAAG
ncbi:oligopeptide transport system permease protein(OppB) [Mycoplasmopsis californica]|uniref:ABC transporter permease n=1 Tax=Mycoplasmopsis equigenitalium TaxID=114883 RepID=A0ABY5J2N3_9BACT|nr:ABC transporter permease [Mycoplasmopsis equigenitalium]UUD36984.1 ABC transporter permease [Mycoplasmopsis equigenitalium]VEU69720.1 oligopeptide transport system permease protein(OppB) [Mycoplasmopsis californica]